MLAWPALNTKRSRSGQSGWVGAWRRNRVQRTYAIGAAPGCPEFAFWTASIESVRMVSMASWSRSVATVIGRAPIGGLGRVGAPRHGHCSHAPAILRGCRPSPDPAARNGPGCLGDPRYRYGLVARAGPAGR